MLPGTKNQHMKAMLTGNVSQKRVSPTICLCLAINTLGWRKPASEPFLIMSYLKTTSRLHFRLSKDQKIIINVSFPRLWMMIPIHTSPCWNERTVGPTVAAKEVGQVDVTTVGQMGTVATRMDVVHVPEKCQTS